MPLIRKTIRIGTGIGMVLLGIIGLILPVMPGWVFLIPGLVILGDHFPPIRRLLDWAKAKAAAAGVTFVKSREKPGTESVPDR